MPTVRAAGAGETVGEDAAIQVATKRTLHVGWHARPVPVVFPRERQIGLQVLLDDLVEDGLLGMAAAGSYWSINRSITPFTPYLWNMVLLMGLAICYYDL